MAFLFFTGFLSLSLLLPLITLGAEGFVPLIGIPGITDQADSTQAYFDALYHFSIIAAAFLAVVKIIFAGVQYMLSDLVTSKEKAKKDIQGALLGLLIVLGAVLILETINPSLTNFTLFANVPTPIATHAIIVSGKEKCEAEGGFWQETNTCIPADARLIDDELTCEADNKNCQNFCERVAVEVRRDGDKLICSFTRGTTEEDISPQPLPNNGSLVVLEPFNEKDEEQNITEVITQSVSSSGKTEVARKIRYLRSDGSARQELISGCMSHSGNSYKIFQIAGEDLVESFVCLR